MNAKLNTLFQAQGITIGSLWRQLGSKEIFGLPLFWLSVILYFPSTLWADIQRLDSDFSSWLLIFLIAHLVFWLSLKGSTRYFHSHLSWETPRPVVNFLIILTCVLIRFLLVLVLYALMGTSQESSLISARFGTALATACVLFIGGGLLTIARAQHILALKSLADAAKNLDHQRIVAVQILQETESKLMDTAQKSLFPQIERIRILVNLDQSREELVERIRSTLRGKVRPLSLELHNLAINIDSIDERREQVYEKNALLPRKVNLHNAMWPSIVFIVNISWIVFAYRSMYAYQLIPQTLLAWCAYPLIVAIIKRLLPRSLEVGPLRAIAILLTIHYLGSVPFFLIVFQKIASPSSYQLVLITYFITSCIYLTLAHISVIVSEQRRVELQLASINAEIQHQLRLLDQKLWIARRNWSSLIHGPVQSSLTVALFKLQNTEAKIDGQVIETLNHLNSLLEHGPDVNTSLVDGFIAIRNTWEGVCRFQFHIPEDVQFLLERNHVASDCVLEIATEIVGNAYRHGGARWVTFHLNFNHNGDLDIFSQNDGSLNPSENGSGLGSKMLDEVTLYWELRRKDSASITEFSALVPIQKFA